MLEFNHLKFQTNLSLNDLPQFQLWNIYQIYGSKYLNHKRVQNLHLKPLGSKDYVTNLIDKQGKPMIWVVFDVNCQILPTQGREAATKFHSFFSDARAPGSKK